MPRYRRCVTDAVLGFIMLAIGLLCCFRGEATFRVIVWIWGAAIGFALGAAAAAGVAGRPGLSGPIAWVAALMGAFLVGALAYWFYRVGVILAVGSVGYAVGAAVATSVGGSVGTATLVGLAVAVLAAFVAVRGDFPTVLLVVATSLAGATVAVDGLGLIGGTMSLPAVAERPLAGIGEQWWWAAVWVGLALGGVVVQSRRARRRQGIG